MRELDGVKLSKKAVGSFKKSAAEYSVKEADDATERKLMVPLVARDNLLVRAPEVTFTRFLAVSLSVDPTNSLNNPTEPVITTGPPYKQPEGMELRYQPFGSMPCKTIEEIQNEAHRRWLKRKAEDGEDVDMLVGSQEDSKKKKKAKVEHLVTPEKRSGGEKDEAKSAKKDKDHKEKDHKEKEHKGESHESDEKKQKEHKKEDPNTPRVPTQFTRVVSTGECLAPPFKASRSSKLGTIGWFLAMDQHAPVISSRRSAAGTPGVVAAAVPTAISWFHHCCTPGSLAVGMAMARLLREDTARICTRPRTPTSSFPRGDWDRCW